MAWYWAINAFLKVFTKICVSNKALALLIAVLILHFLSKRVFLQKQAFLHDLSTRPTCRNVLPNYLGDLFLVLLMCFHCKSHGGLTSIHLVTLNAIWYSANVHVFEHLFSPCKTYFLKNKSYSCTYHFLNYTYM